MPRGALFKFNDITITAPDEQVWSDITQGNDLNGLPVYSPYKRLELRQQVGDECNLDWFDYKGTVLTSITCPPPDEIAEYQRYDDAICQSVHFRHRQGVAQEIVAILLVNTKSVTL